MLRPAAKASGDVTQVKSILLVTLRSGAHAAAAPAAPRPAAGRVRTLCLTSRHSRGGPLSLDGISQELAARREIERDGTIAAIVSGRSAARHRHGPAASQRLRAVPAAAHADPVPACRQDPCRRGAGARARRLRGAGHLQHRQRTRGGPASPGCALPAVAPDGDATPAAAAADVGRGDCPTCSGRRCRAPASTCMRWPRHPTSCWRPSPGHGIHGWLQLVSDVDDRTYRHCMMVSGFVTAFALALGFSHTDCDRLTRASPDARHRQGRDFHSGS